MSAMHSDRLKSFLIPPMALLQRLIKPFRLRPSRTIAGHKFFLDPATDIGLELLVTGHFEREAIAQCARFIRPDGIVVDVGANIGVHTVHFAGFAGLGKVICLEPARSTFAHLLQNVKHLDNVIPLNIGLSDTTGLQPFFVAADNAYSGLKDTKREAIVHQELVACFRGDDILLALARSQRIDLVKIDVEGFEMQVLAGMRELLVTKRPVIFCEIFGGQQSNADPQATVQFCVSLGYDAFVLSGAQLVPAGVHDDRLYNYFFIPRQPQ
jgi:FkbM family methyltransferase